MKPNVLFLILDGVRAQNTSLHGYPRDTTPFLREFSERATVYEQARSPGIWSLPSHTSIFTGEPSAAHGVNTTDDKLPPGNTVWERLSNEYGYSTGVFSTNPFLTQICGIKNAFKTVYAGDQLLFPEALNPREVIQGDKQAYGDFLKSAVRNRYPVKSLLNGVGEKVIREYPTLVPESLQFDNSASTFVDEFMGWADETDGPWAACINFMDSHAPYDPAPEFDRWSDEEHESLRNSIQDGVWEFTSGQRPWRERRAMMSLYDGCILQIDRQIERLVFDLEHRGELDDTLIVITSDHGEGFGERSNVRPSVRQSMHGYGIHEVLLHVPLLVRAPGQRDGRRVPELASLARFPDVVGSAVEGSADPEGFVSEGPMLVSSYEREHLLNRAKPYHDDVSPFSDDAHALYVPNGDSVTKYAIWGDDAAVVEIENAHERRKLSDDGGRRVKRELAKYEDVILETDTVGRIEGSTKEQLQNLGYI